MQSQNAKCKMQYQRPSVQVFPLQWRHNEPDGISNHQPHDCLHNRLFGRRSKETSKLRFIGLYVGNSPVIGEFLAQWACNAENVSIWWRHHASMGNNLVAGNWWWRRFHLCKWWCIDSSGFNFSVERLGRRCANGTMSIKMITVF